MSDTLHAMALATVLAEMKLKGPNDPFSRQVFLDILKLLPPAPNLPGLEVFLEIYSKVVGTFIDLMIVRDGKVLLTWRDNCPTYAGWHIPGGARTSGMSPLADAQRLVDKEIGNGCRVKSVRKVDTIDHDRCLRVHHTLILYAVEMEGEPIIGPKCGWFSEMPADMISIQHDYWKYVEREIELQRTLAEKS